MTRKSLQLATQTPVSKGIIRCTREVRGKTLKSINVSGTDNFNIVSVLFMDGTAFSVELFPTVRLKAEYNDWTIGEGKLLKRWPLLSTR